MQSTYPLHAEWSKISRDQSGLDIQVFETALQGLEKLPLVIFVAAKAEFLSLVNITTLPTRCKLN